MTAAGPPRVTLVEVAPRDGLQNDEAELPTAVKCELVTRAIAAGARRVEVTSFVSPGAVPKLADGEALVGMLLAGGPLDASLIGLVVNERGVGRAAACGVDEVNAVVVASDTFGLANQRMTAADAVGRLPDLLGAAHAAGLRASVTIAAAFGCPFEGEVPVGRVADVAAAAAAAGADEITLADTIGVAVPADVAVRVAAVRAAAGSGPLRAHFHDTRRTGTANVLAAVGAGVESIDASLGGLGGCPFAPGASGNVATEDVVYALERTGMRTGMSLDLLVEAARWLGAELGHPVAGMLGRAGVFPPATARDRP